jgi:hypothetical protein
MMKGQKNLREPRVENPAMAVDVNLREPHVENPQWL